MMNNRMKAFKGRCPVLKKKPPPQTYLIILVKGVNTKVEKLPKKIGLNHVRKNISMKAVGLRESSQF